MNIKENLVKARSYIVFLAALACAFSAVAWVEYRSGWAVNPSGSRIRASSDRAEYRAARPLTDREVQWARIAWRYFEKNVDPASGLVGSVENYPSATMWDTGSYLLAVISAEQLGLIDRSEFDGRMHKALASLQGIALFDGKLPNKAYDTRSLQMTDYVNAPTPRGIGWSAIDIARLLVPLNILAWHYPQHSQEALAVLGHWKVGDLSKGGELQGARVGADGRTELIQEGRLGYEQYAAKSFALMGLDVTGSGNYERQIAHKDIYGVAVAYDRRIPEVFGSQNYVISEPYVLDGLEFGADADSRELSWRVYLAQQRRWERTGILTAVTEDHLDQPPYFVYNTVFDDGKAWNTVTEKGEDASKFRSLSVKAAFGWYALYPTDYTQRLVEAVADLNDPQRGWYAGRFEANGETNRAMSANTNAIVLECLAFIKGGSAVRYH
jgi:hypothetical protein